MLIVLIYVSRFRWVDLQLQSLTSCRSQKDIEDKINNLPEDLDETYDRILSAISGPDIPRAKRLLYFVAFARHPMAIMDLADIAAIDIEVDSDGDRIEEQRLSTSRCIRDSVWACRCQIY